MLFIISNAMALFFCRQCVPETCFQTLLNASDAKSGAVLLSKAVKPNIFRCKHVLN